MSFQLTVCLGESGSRTDGVDLGFSASPDCCQYTREPAASLWQVHLEITWTNLWIFFQLYFELVVLPSLILHFMTSPFLDATCWLVVCVQLDLWDVDGARSRPHCSRSDYGDGDGKACCHGALCGQEGVHDQGRDGKGGNQSAAGCKSHKLGGHTMFFFVSIIVQYLFFTALSSFQNWTPFTARCNKYTSTNVKRDLAGLLILLC